MKQIKKNVSKSHPRWRFLAESNEFKFGGKLNDSELNNLISFDEIPKGLVVNSLKQVRFGINFELFFNSQINGKLLSYVHDDFGFPKLMSKNIKISNPYSDYPLKETKVKLALSTKKYNTQTWEGNCNKIGGSPIWIQEEETIRCPICKSEMSFIFQLDSGLPDENAQNDFEIMFGNDGMLYAFWCDEDKISSYIWQST